MLGLETEYALVFSPEVGSPAPVQEKIFEALSEVLRKEYLCLEAAYRKGGFFLANGGLVHYEAEAEAVHRGLLEMATPECATVRDAVAYHRAQESIVLRLLPGVDARLRENGFAGRLVLGKHSSDYEGHTFGTHENYLVHDDLGVKRTLALWSTFALFHLVRLPLTLVFVLMHAAAIAAYVTLFLSYLLYLAVQGLRGQEPPADGQMPLPMRLLQGCIELFVRGVFHVQFLEQKYLLPFFSRLAGRIILPRFRSHLVPFLVTRLIFTGPGWLRTEKPHEDARFVLSPKASAIGAVMEVFHDPAAKPIIDIKNLFRGGLTLLARGKRLHISYSDSNMSEWALWLKVGTTELVVRMLEDGHVPEGVELADPLAALRVVNEDLTFRAPLRQPDGTSTNALEMQRRYLETARRYVAEHRPGDDEARRLVAAWDQALRGLASDPTALADRLDWVAKRDLMDEAMEGTRWEAIGSLLPVVRKLEAKRGPQLIERAADVERVLARAGEEARELEPDLARAGIRPDQLMDLCRLFYQLKKIDLRYHEISTEGGYYQQMEREGAFCRVLTEAEIERATQTPPTGTRATLRGYYVREAARLGMDALIGWERIIVPSRFKVIPMPDASSDVPPVELADLKGEGFVRSMARVVAFLPHLVAPY